MKRKGWAAAFTAALGISSPTYAATWHFDFTTRASGFFEVDAASFVIPSNAANPTTFNITAADIDIADAGGVLGHIHFTEANVTATSCTPGECSAKFSIAPFVIPQVITYSALNLQLNMPQIWTPWDDHQTMQEFLFTDPFALSVAWNDAGPAERTVIDPTPLPAALPLFVTGLGALGLLGWRRKRKAAAVAD